MIAGAICLAIGLAMTGIAIFLKEHARLRQDIIEIKRRANNL